MQGSHSRGDRNRISGRKDKQNIVEVLEFESDLHSQQENNYYSKNGSVRMGDARSKNSEELLKKLIDNIRNNHQLQNESVRAQFKLDLIKDMEHLNLYKNLLNAMAALFYTNHRMNDVSSMFSAWRQLTA